LLGAGITHAGGFTDLLEFVNSIFVDSTLFDPSNNICDAPSHAKCVSDVTSFVQRWDSGLGQAAHFATRLAASQSPSTRAAIELELDYLLAQANPGVLDPWGPAACCDIAVFGYSNGSATIRRWTYRRSINAFVADDGTPSRDLQAFKTAAGVATSGEDNVFVGLPVGRGEGFGVDADNDGLILSQDSAPFDPTAPGTTTPAALTSSTLATPWITTRAARLRFETDEPTTATVRYWAEFGTGIVHTVSHESLSRVHAFMLTDLRPSTAFGNVMGTGGVPIGTNSTDINIRYFGDITLKNASGQASAPIPFGPTPATKPFTIPTFGLGTANAEFNPQAEPGDRQRHLEHIVSASTFGELSRDPATGLVTARVDLHVSFVRGGNFNPAGTSFDLVDAPDRVVIGRVLSKKRAAVNPGGLVVNVNTVNPSTNTIAADLARLLLVNPPAGSHELCGKQMDLDGVNVGDNFEGRLLATNVATDATGFAYVKFTFTDPTLTTDDEVWFVIDAVVEVNNALWNDPSFVRIRTDSTPCPAQPSGTVPGTGTGRQVVVLPTTTFAGNGQIAWTGYSFPDTKEERALVKGKLP
jgi:hypothetical protein